MRDLSMAIIRMCHRLGKSFIVSFHTAPSHLEYSRIRERVNREEAVRELLRLLNQSECIVVTHSQRCREDLIRVGISRDIELVPIGISQIFDPKIYENISELFDIIYIGEISQMKGVDLVIESLIHVKNKYGKHLRAIMLGEGPAREELKNIVRQSALKVLFPGYVQHSRVPYYLSASKVLVHLSRTENCPLAVLEALSMNRKVVATPVGGIPEIAMYGKCILVPHCPKKAGDAMWMAVVGHDPLGKFSVKQIASGKTISRRYSIESQAQGLLRLYETLHDDRLRIKFKFEKVV
jgi:glycosyltransferase involved in cell wall biosynthesis